MSAPSFLDLESFITELDGATSCLWQIADGLDDDELTNALNFLAGEMRLNVNAARAWLEAAMKAKYEAKGTGPRAVS